MNKRELIKMMSEKSGLTTRQTERALNEMLYVISEELIKGDVRIFGFGTFAINERKGRLGRNPQTGEVMEIKARRVPVFRAGSMLKDQLNQKK